jgi:hypothetical protein
VFPRRPPRRSRSPPRRPIVVLWNIRIADFPTLHIHLVPPIQSYFRNCSGESVDRTRRQDGGLTCLRGFRATQTTTTASSSSCLLSFTAGVCRGPRGWSVVSGECRWWGGGLTCMQVIRATQTTMTSSLSSFWSSFMAGMCGDGDWESWGWSVVSEDDGVGDLPGCALFLFSFLSSPPSLPSSLVTLVHGARQS